MPLSRCPVLPLVPAVGIHPGLATPVTLSRIARAGAADEIPGRRSAANNLRHAAWIGPPPSPSLQLGIMTEQVSTRAPAGVPKRRPERTSLGDPIPSLRKAVRRPVRASESTSPHMIPCELSRASSWRSSRKDRDSTLRRQAMPSQRSPAPKAAVEYRNLDALAAKALGVPTDRRPVERARNDCSLARGQAEQRKREAARPRQRPRANKAHASPILGVNRVGGR